jgi:hypothetical protein
LYNLDNSCHDTCYNIFPMENFCWFLQHESHCALSKRKYMHFGGVEVDEIKNFFFLKINFCLVIVNRAKLYCHPLTFHRIYFINMSLHRMNISLNNLIHQLVISSMSHFINWSIQQLVNSSARQLINWTFHQLIILSTSHLILQSFH